MRGKRYGAILAILFIVLVMAFLGGCGKKAKTTPTSGPTALGSLAVAKSSVATAAPDAKLLLVQTAQGVAPTATPIWVYLFGSPSTDKTYAVYVLEGKSMGAQEYGEAGLSKEEWKNVPDEAWKVDSDEAYSKALDKSGATTDPNGWMMGMITYKAKADTSTIEAFVWNVQFDPGTSGATDKMVKVDANTGKTAIEE